MNPKRERVDDDWKVHDHTNVDTNYSYTKILLNREVRHNQSHF